MPGYSPKDPATVTTLDELKDFVSEELGFVAQSFGEGEKVTWLRPSARAPDKPREGMVVYADGANFDPGDGKGTYEYDGAAWRALFTSGQTTYVNILEHGGVGDGVTDNSAALTAAVAALSSRGGTLYFPQGKYLFNSARVITAPSLNAIWDLTILGDGADASILYWPAGGGMEIRLNGTGPGINNQSFHARDISFTTGANNTGTGLKLNQLGSNTGSFAALTELNRVTFRGDDGIQLTHSWAVGLMILNVSNINVVGCLFHGPGGVSGKGVTYQGGNGSNIAVVLNLLDCTINSHTMGFEVENEFTQGITISQCNISNCTNGVNIPGGIGTVGGASLAQLAIQGCQFGMFTSGSIAINAASTSPIAQLMVSDTLFLLSANTAAINAPLQNFTIVDNTFQASSVTGTTGIQDVTNPANTCGVIEGNSFIVLGSAITLQAGAHNIGIGPNKFFGCTTNITNGSAAANNNIGTWISSQDQGYIVQISNEGSAAGDHALTLSGGTQGATADNATKLIQFLNGNRVTEIGSIKRSEGSGLQFNATNLNIQGGTLTSTLFGSVSASFQVNMGNLHNAAGDHGVAVFSGGSAATDVATVCMFFLDPSSNSCGSITRNDAAGVRHVSYNTSSDIRLKKNIRETKRGLREIEKIRVIDYGLEEEIQGLLAQEVREVYPEVVRVGGEDAEKEPWQLDYGRLTPLLIRAIQQLSERVRELESRG